MRLNANTLKLVAIIAMTVDHIAWLTWPGLNPDPGAITLHFLGRFTAPIMWFFIAEGLYHSRDRWRYFGRLAAFALISHFAFGFAFGADPAAINGTSVMFPLAMSVLLYQLLDLVQSKLVQTLLVVAFCLICFPADFSCVALMAPIYISRRQGDRDAQLRTMTVWILIYVAVYVFLVDLRYGLVQLGLLMPAFALQWYNGERGPQTWLTKWGFYLYYPAHLLIIGALRLLIWGDIPLVV